MHERILDLEPSSVYIFDLVEKKSVFVNQHWIRAFGYTAEELMAMENGIAAIFHADDLLAIAAHHKAWRAADDGETRSIELRIRDKQGQWHWLFSQETPFARDASGQVSQILGVANDISERKRAEILLGGQNSVLAMIASGKALSDILAALVRVIEEQLYGMFGSILLLDEDGVHVRHGAAPSLPPEFVAAVDNQPIGPAAGSCGTAAYRRQAVYVADIASDPLWSDYREIAMRSGLRASWSTPIFDSGGRVLGTFAMYYTEPGLPRPEHLRLIGAATHAAAIAISHDRARTSLQDSAARLLKAQQVAQMGFLEWNLKTDHIFCSNEICAMYGIESDASSSVTLASADFIAACCHPDDLAYVKRNLELAVRGEKKYDIDHRILRPDGKMLWVHAQAELICDADGQAQTMIGTVIDISKRKLAEAQVQRLTQLYAALSQCNQAIVHCTSEAQLLPQVCRDAVDFGGMKMAWIGMLDSDGKHIVPRASYGLNCACIESIEVSSDAGARDPVSAALLENRPYWCQDFQADPATAAWHDCAEKCGWGASASLPLQHKGVVTGTFNLYAEATNAFDMPAQNLLVEMAVDISFALERFVSEEQRRQERSKVRKLSHVVEQNPNGIVITDLDLSIEYVNAAFVKMTGYRPAELIGKKLDSLQSVAARDDASGAMLACLNADGNWYGEHLSRRKNGAEYFQSLSVSPMRGVDGAVCQYLGIQSDISERKQAEERIQYLANYDALTGLPNRIKLESMLEQALVVAQQKPTRMALLFVDIDRFKDINDTLGHGVGDAILVELARRFRSALSSADTVSRLGGDEFILLLTACDAQRAAQVAQQLLQLIAEPYRNEQYDLIVTASIGIALYPDDGADIDILSSSADMAMYRAKKEGRDCFRFFTAEMQKRATHNVQLVSALRHAIRLGQMHVHYQPQVSIGDGRVIGAEALLRWTHPILGRVAPAEFIPVAEDCGLIVPIGEWVLRTAIRQIKRWMEIGRPPIVVAVNLSAVQFRRPGLPDLVRDMLDQEHVPAHFLELELTEGVAMHDPLGAIAMMNQFHERGIRMSIDDFGTGYSSLSYLKKFKVYKLKIDQSFVRDISTDAEDKVIVAAIIGMAKSLGLQTIAEGVETAEQLAFLRDQGCDETQGFYYSRPMPASQFLHVVAGG